MKKLSALESVLNHDKPSRRFLDGLNENQMKDLSGEIFAKLYWSKRNPQWYEKDTKRLFARLRWIQRIIKKRLKTGKVKPELTENGSVMERFSFPYGDTLDFFHRYLRHPKWEVMYQDSGCSAFWKNEATLELCTYCEGDVVMMKAPDKVAFFRDCNRLSWWYADNA
ncbi:hypothetical protein ABLA30_02365 [Xenorhabdus nematophila]|uniref:hypothetical protein n=1 Tax=Enterobacterales TaxID=91347 RepID=UPI000DEB6078|nr:hypothetical protein [Escherichia coli]RBX77621.1 hypothetical protein DS977_17565 [Escherichia coli]RBY39095.1 hypothetical protein DS958_00350 [Escherichia coli]